MARALADRRGASHRARPEAPDRRPFVGEGLPDDQIVLEQLVVVLGVCHRRLEQLAPVARHLTRGEREDSACLRHGLATQVPAHHPGLARRGPNVACVSANDFAARCRFSRALPRVAGKLFGGLGRHPAPFAASLASSRSAGGRRFFSSGFFGGSFALCGALSVGLLASSPLVLRRSAFLRGGLLRPAAVFCSAVGSLAAGFFAEAFLRPVFAAASFAGPRPRGSFAPSPPRRYRTLPEPACPRKCRVGSELAELVPDHRLADEDGDVFLAVVHGDRVPDHLREDRRRARPRPSIFLLFSAFSASMRLSSALRPTGPSC